MKRLFLWIVLVSTFGLAQETATDTTKHWTRKGVFTFLANQSSFSNWQAGGQNNFAGNVGVNYDFNYKKGDWNWDNKIIVAYGLTKIKGADTQKTDDRIEFNSLVGRKAIGYWFYSAFFNFKTQMDTGLDPASQTVKISHFFSPAFFQLGPGMLWKKSDNLKVNFAPATSKLIMVHNHFTELGSSFGVAQGETTRYELGAAVNGYYKFKLMENVSVENILNLYSNYLEEAQNVDLDYQLNIVMKINKFLSTNFAFQTIYDDNAFRGFQTKQIIGLGVNYGF
ncbi:MAG: DUF3078 domain-containing protein [Flavobacterium sp.]|uniref:DUF3078 domain-containing protein n=1 Tax=Flavobacterium sp. TaxID=239 RepID=UPI0025B8B649|nr:DUF3078 domain-containing protein [Flavobacterium sp.]MCA1965334.1 DUF3078 domain-containing protein [Flavobacterium sp.]